MTPMKRPLSLLLLALAPFSAAFAQAEPAAECTLASPEAPAPKLEKLLAAAPTPAAAKALVEHLNGPAGAQNANSAYVLALCHLYGVGMPANPAEASRRTLAAASLGSPEAQRVAFLIAKESDRNLKPGGPAELSQTSEMMLWMLSMSDPQQKQSLRLRVARFAAALGKPAAACFVATRDLAHGDDAQKAAATKSLKALAQSGDTDAMALFGEKLFGKDPDAEKLLRQAAAKGSAKACRTLANRVPAEATAFLSRAVELGDKSATNELASLLFNSGKPEDARKAVELVRLPAERGDARARSLYIDALAKGQGVAKDTAKALAMLEADAAQNPDNAFMVAEAYSDGRYGKTDPAKAFHWYKVAHDNRSSSQFIYAERLAACYAEGKGVEKNPAEAERLLRAYAKANPNLGCWRSLAEKYDKGDIVPKDAAKALKCLRSGAKAGDADSMFQLADRLDEAPSATQADRDEAASWREKGEAKTDPGAYSHLAFKYQHGFGRAPNLPAAAYWYSRAANHPKNHADARASARKSLAEIEPKLTLVELRALHKRLNAKAAAE